MITAMDTSIAINPVWALSFMSLPEESAANQQSYYTT